MSTDHQSQPAAGTKTNVVVILVDDMGYSDLGCYGGEIGTPSVDALAETGVRCSQFYNTARCSPSRASLLTGLHPHQTGVAELVNDDGPGGYPGSLTERCATLAETFAAAGYRTQLTGKWHLSNQREHPDASWPTRRGFERFWGTIAGAGSYFAPTTLHDQEEPVDAAGLAADFYYTDEIGTRAAAGIRTAAEAGDDRPFFAYVAFTAPHWPLHATEADRAAVRGRFDAGWDDLRARRRQAQLDSGLLQDANTADVADPEVTSWEDEPDQDWQLERMEAYAAQIRAMDRNVGRVVEAIEETGQRDHTLIIFLSDNGGCAEELSSEPDSAERFRHNHLIIPAAAPDGSPMKVGNTPTIKPGTADTYTSYGRAWAHLSNTPFRLYKRWVHEGGIATPLIVSWPDGGLDTGSVITTPHQLTDLAPTLLAATGVAALTERNGQALPELPGVDMTEAWRGAELAPHTLFWEHIGNCATRRENWKLVREEGGPWELYDLGSDRSEQHDRSGELPELVSELAADWQRWADAVGVIPYPDVLAARAQRPRQPA